MMGGISEMPMERRRFLHLSPGMLLADRLKALAGKPMPMTTLGKTGPAGLPDHGGRVPHARAGRRGGDPHHSPRD